MTAISFRDPGIYISLKALLLVHGLSLVRGARARGRTAGRAAGNGADDLGGAREVDGTAVARFHAHRVQPVLAVHQLHDPASCIPHLNKGMPQRTV